MDSRGTDGRIYKEYLYTCTLLHTKYESSRPCVSERKIFFCFSHRKSMVANDPRGRAIFDPRDMVGRIYKEDHYTLLHTKYESSGHCGFGEEFFVCFSHEVPGPVWTPGARLAGFLKNITIHCNTQNMKALGLVVAEKEIFFYVFPIASLWEQLTLGVGPLLTPGASLAGFLKRTTILCCTQNMKALGLVVSEKKNFSCFSHDAWAGPVWTPGARSAEFIKMTFIHSYTQNRKAIGLVVLEKNIFFMFFPIVSLWELIPPGRGHFLLQCHGWIYKEDHYTLLHTKYESSGPCGFGEKDVFFLCFSHCKSKGAITPGAGPFLTPGAWLSGFIKRTTILCCTQNMETLGLVVSEKKICLCFSHDTHGAGP